MNDPTVGAPVEYHCGVRAALLSASERPADVSGYVVVDYVWQCVRCATVTGRPRVVLDEQGETMSEFNPTCTCGHDLASHGKVWPEGTWHPEGRVWRCYADDGDTTSETDCPCSEFRRDLPPGGVITMEKDALLQGPVSTPPGTVPHAALLTVLRDDGHPMIIVRRDGKVTVDGLTATDEAGRTFLEKVRELSEGPSW